MRSHIASGADTHMSQELEICIAWTDYERARIQFSIICDYCMINFRPPQSPYGAHYSKFPSYKIVGSKLRFWLVPSNHYKLSERDDLPQIFFDRQTDYPYLPLPIMLTGVCKAVAAASANDIGMGAASKSTSSLHAHANSERREETDSLRNLSKALIVANRIDKKWCLAHIANAAARRVIMDAISEWSLAPPIPTFSDSSGSRSSAMTWTTRSSV
jgi:hypothetical protein